MLRVVCVLAANWRFGHHLVAFPVHGASLLLQMVKIPVLSKESVRDHSPLESPALPSLPPTPPPKDYLDSLIQYSVNHYAPSVPGLPNETGQINAYDNSYFTTSPNHELGAPQLVRPTLRLGSSFARPALPTLTLTPISAAGPDSAGSQASNPSPAVAAKTALRAVSNASKKATNKLPRRPSLPNFESNASGSAASDSGSDVSNSNMKELVSSN